MKITYYLGIMVLSTLLSCQKDKADPKAVAQEWEAINIKPFDGLWGIYQLEFFNASEGFAAAFKENDDGLYFYRTVNGGRDWTQLSEGLWAFSFFNSSIGYALDEDFQLVMTTDGGVNWTVLNNLQDIYGVHYNDGKMMLFQYRNGNTLVWESGTPADPASFQQKVQLKGTSSMWSSGFRSEGPATFILTDAYGFDGDTSFLFRWMNGAKDSVYFMKESDEQYAFDFSSVDQGLVANENYYWKIDFSSASVSTRGTFDQAGWVYAYHASSEGQGYVSYDEQGIFAQDGSALTLSQGLQVGAVGSFTEARDGSALFATGWLTFFKKL